MPKQNKILVDTNAYLRLAQTVRPLLFVPFGDQQYCLYIIPELNDELARHRLQLKFPWITEQEYRDNRQFSPKISKKQKKAIAENFDFIWRNIQTEPGPSRVDALYLAYALELNIPVVTDDQDMKKVAKEYDIIVMPTIELLKIMYDAGHVTLSTVKGLVEYWRYIEDKPANLDADYLKFFGA